MINSAAHSESRVLHCPYFGISTSAESCHANMTYMQTVCFANMTLSNCAEPNEMLPVWQNRPINKYDLKFILKLIQVTLT